MKYHQPILAFTTLLIVIACTAGIMKFVPEGLINTWLALIFIISVPVQVAMGSLLDAGWPRFLSRINQPYKGMLIIGMCALLGCIFSYIAFLFVGGGISLPRPPLISYSIVTVVVTFWFVIVWQCWPVTKITTRASIIAISIICVAFFAGYALFKLFFNFEFMQGSSVYVDSLDPHGWFESWNVIAFMVTTIALIFTFVLLDFWPASMHTSVSRPFIWGLSNTFSILLIAGGIYLVFIDGFKLDPVKYLVNGPICYIFGMFIPLNLMEGKLFERVRLSIRRLLLILVSVFSALLLNILYFEMSEYISPGLKSGAPVYALELWVANAMLAFSFPILVAITDHLQFWPMRVNNPLEDIKQKDEKASNIVDA